MGVAHPDQPARIAVRPRPGAYPGLSRETVVGDYIVQHEIITAN